MASLASGGSLVREARRRASLSQEGLARRAGLRQPAVSRIERDIGSPRLGTLDRLLEACGLELQLAERPGRHVDVSLIRDRLAMTPAERARRAAAEWQATRPFRSRG